MRTVTAVRGEWLVEAAPHYYDLSNFPKGDTYRALESLYRRKADAEATAAGAGGGRRGAAAAAGAAGAGAVAGAGSRS